jgi:hypothetical protein
MLRKDVAIRTLNLLSLIVLIFASLSSAKHHYIELQPGPDAGKDTYISSASPNENFGDVPFLLILYEESVTDVWTLIQFNLDPYMGASVDYALLWLDCFEYESPCVAEVFRIAESWDEHTVTFNNRPGYNLDIVSEATVIPDDWMVVDVAGIIHSWLGGLFTNNGFYIRVEENPEIGYAEFRSSDYTVNPYARPELQLSYTYAGVTPSSYGSIKAAFR